LIFTKEKLIEAVNVSANYLEVARYITGRKKISGSTARLVSKRIKEFNIDCEKFKDRYIISSKKKNNYLNAKDILIFDKTKVNRTPRRLLLRALLEKKVKYECTLCGNEGKYNNKELKLDIDHIDGDWQNNKENNLRFLCPNCHSQTETFGYKGLKP